MKRNSQRERILGDKTLQPGDYTIQSFAALLRNNVLLIYSDNGMRFEVSAMTIPTMDKKTPEHTNLILRHFGQEFYFDKIWHHRAGQPAGTGALSGAGMMLRRKAG